MTEPQTENASRTKAQHTHFLSLLRLLKKTGNSLLGLIEFCLSGYGTRANDKKSKGITESADEDTRKGQGRPSLFFVSCKLSVFSMPINLIINVAFSSIFFRPQPCWSKTVSNEIRLVKRKKALQKKRR